MEKGAAVLAGDEPYWPPSTARADLAIAEAGLADQQRTEAAERANAVIAAEQVTRAEQNPRSLPRRALARLQQLRPKGLCQRPAGRRRRDGAPRRRVGLRQTRLQQEATERLVGNPAAAVAIVAAREAALAISNT